MVFKKARSKSNNPAKDSEAIQKTLKDLEDLKEFLEIVEECEVMKEEMKFAKASNPKKRNRVEVNEEIATEEAKAEFLKYMNDHYLAKDPITKKTKATVELEQLHQVLEGPEYLVFQDICEKMSSKTSE